MNIKQLKKIIPARLDRNINILITGAPGIGKSDIISQIAADNNYNLIISHPVTADPTDYKGLPTVSNNTAVFLPYADLSALITADKPTIFFIDDLGQAMPSVQAAIMQLVLARQINGHKIADCVRFIAATNRVADRAGVSGILEPLKGRFEIIELTPNLDDFKSYCFANNINSILPAFLDYRPDLLHSFKPSASLTNSPSPRNWVRTASIIDDTEKNLIPADCITELCAGNVGDAAALELTAFIRIFQNLPDLEKILTAPETVAVPADIAVKYALSGALLKKTNKTNFKNILYFLELCGIEFCIIFIKNLVAFDKSYAATKEFIQFAAANAEVLI